MKQGGEKLHSSHLLLFQSWQLWELSVNKEHGGREIANHPKEKTVVAVGHLGNLLTAAFPLLFEPPKKEECSREITHPATISLEGGEPRSDVKWCHCPRFQELLLGHISTPVIPLIYDASLLTLAQNDLLSWITPKELWNLKHPTSVYCQVRMHWNSLIVSELYGHALQWLESLEMNKERVLF